MDEGNPHQRMAQEQNPLTQLLQLAQLAHLTGQTDVEQQQLEQQDQKNRTAAALHLLGLHQEAKQHEATLAETTRSREAAVKGSLNEALINHLSQRLDVPLSVLADTLEKSGNPELAGTLREVHAADVQKKVATHLGALKVLGADAKKRDTYLQAIAGDPEVSAAVHAALPTTQPVVPVVDPTSPGTNIGHAARLYGMALTEPVTANVLALKSLYQNRDKLGGQARDFWNALINNPQTAK